MSQDIQFGTVNEIMSVSSSMVNHPMDVVNKDFDNDVKEDNPVNGAQKNNADQDSKKDSDGTSAIINQPIIKQPGTTDRAYIGEGTTGQLNTKVRILLFFMLIMIEMFFFVFQSAVFPSRDVRIKPSVTKQRKQGFIFEFELSRKV